VLRQASCVDKSQLQLHLQWKCNRAFKLQAAESPSAGLAGLKHHGKLVSAPPLRKFVAPLSQSLMLLAAAPSSLPSGEPPEAAALGAKASISSVMWCWQDPKRDDVIACDTLSALISYLVSPSASATSTGLEMGCAATADLNPSRNADVSDSSCIGTETFSRSVFLPCFAAYSCTRFLMSVKLL
jgi:hypothetical protein